MQTYRLVSFLALVTSPLSLGGALFLFGFAGSTNWQAIGILAVIAVFFGIRVAFLRAHPEFKPSIAENTPLALLILAAILAYITGHALGSVHWVVPGVFTLAATILLATGAMFAWRHFLRHGSYRRPETGRYTH